MVLCSAEAFWDVHPDLASSKAAKLALKGRSLAYHGTAEPWHLDALGFKHEDRSIVLNHILLSSSMIYSIYIYMLSLSTQEAFF